MTPKKHPFKRKPEPNAIGMMPPRKRNIPAPNQRVPEPESEPAVEVSEAPPEPETVTLVDGEQSVTAILPANANADTEFKVLAVADALSKHTVPELDQFAAHLGVIVDGVKAEKIAQLLDSGQVTATFDGRGRVVDLR